MKDLCWKRTLKAKTRILLPVKTTYTYFQRPYKESKAYMIKKRNFPFQDDFNSNVDNKENEISSVITLKKTHFHSPSIYQLQIVSWLRVGVCAHFLLSLEEFHLATLVQVLCMLSVLSVCSYVHQSCKVSKMLFSYIHTQLLALKIIELPFLPRSLKLEGRDSINASHLGLSSQKSLTLYTLSRCGSLQ